MQFSNGLSAMFGTMGHTSSGGSNQMQYSQYYEQLGLLKQQAQQQSRQQARWQALLGHSIAGASSSLPELKKQNTLELIKKSVRQIKAEAVSQDAREKINKKIERLESLGVKAQAAVLKLELMVRAKLARVQEWDYKVLPYAEIEKFVDEHKNWDGRGGYYKVNIEPLEKYAGNKTVEAESKDQIIPDFVLDKVEEAKQRQVFDEFSVLYVEKVADPLLLGSFAGCKDYFLIAQWDDDIKFEDIVKE